MTDELVIDETIDTVDDGIVESEVTPTETAPAPILGLTPLVDVTDFVQIQDMNYIFYYKRLMKPDDNPTNYFILHYREERQSLWSSCKSLLTNVFTVARTEDVIRQIQASLEGTIQNEQHYRSQTSVKSWFTLSGYQIDIEEEPDVDLVLFKLMTNLDAEIEVLTTSNLTFNVINGFSGNHALQLNYGLQKTMTSRIGEEDKVLPINNIFLLDNFTKRLIHDNHLTISIEDVTNVQQAIQSRVNDFRRAPVSVATIEDFKDKFPKKFAMKFIVLFENLPENLRNFYYASYILSALLDSERKIALEIKLRDFLSTKVRDTLEFLDAAAEMDAAVVAE